MEALSDLLVQLLPSFLRCFGALALLPLEWGLSGWGLKVILALAFGTFLQAGVVDTVDLSILGALRQVFCGVLLALPLALLLEGVSALGELFDTARGQNMSDMIDPLRAQSNSRSGVLSNSIVWSSLLLGGVLEKMLVHLSQSGRVWPHSTVGSVADLDLFLALGKLNLIFFVGTLRAFLPIALLFVLVEIALLWIQRALPNFFGQSESMLIKSTLGIGVVILALRDPDNFGQFFNFDWFSLSPLLKG